MWKCNRIFTYSLLKKKTDLEFVPLIPNKLLVHSKLNFKLMHYRCPKPEQFRVYLIKLVLSQRY